MSTSQQPMFQLLIKTLEKESKETKAMFFADSESDLLKAYQEGVEARKNNVSISKNPYPETVDPDTGMYSKNLVWSEGFLQTFISEP